MTFGLWFAPGWANWWAYDPVGLARGDDDVPPTILMSTLGSGMAGMIGFAMGLSRQKGHARRVVIGWFRIWAVLTALSCVTAYIVLHAERVELFPNGYGF